MSFDKLQLNTTLASILPEKGFITPTPIQEQAIPVIMSGKDVLGIAQTGTGKTAAFVLPLINRLAKERSPHVRALILAPTRELAEQIDEVMSSFGAPLGIKSMTAYGGTSLHGQRMRLRKGVDVVIGCPGRVYDLIEHREMALDHLEVLVLDEADQMFDMGFIPTIRKILRYLPSERQTLLFSATMPNEIRGLAESVLKNPQRIEVSSQAPVATVTHVLYPVPSHRKTALLLKLLEKIETESVLIFVRTKHRAKRLSQQLQDSKLRVTSLQGNLSQGQRRAAMQGFRDGEFQVMVATDIAARGIDVSSISHVINYDIPNTVEAYTHRIGRTGRAAKNGDAFTFVSAEDTIMVRAIERALKTQIERKTLEGFDYKAAPQEYLQRQHGSLQDEERRPMRSHGQRSFGSQGGGRGGQSRSFRKSRPQRRGPSSRTSNSNSRYGGQGSGR